MARVVVLGGAGVVGTVAVKTLATFPDFSKVVIADIDAEKSNKIIKINPNKISFLKIDVNNQRELRRIIDQFDVIVNTIGPFYKYGPLVLASVVLGYITFQDIPNLIQFSKTFTPDPENVRIYNRIFKECLALYKNNKAAYHRLNK